MTATEHNALRSPRPVVSIDRVTPLDEYEGEYAVTWHYEWAQAGEWLVGADTTTEINVGVAWDGLYILRSDVPDDVAQALYNAVIDLRARRAA